MAKARGKCPSLITSNHGKPRFESAKRKRKCKRCNRSIMAGTDCVSIPTPGTMGARTYCLQCLLEIIKQSREDLDRLEEQANS